MNDAGSNLVLCRDLLKAAPMSKFAKLTPQPVGAVQTLHDTPTTVTHEGGAGYERDARSELYLLAISNMVSESTLYETPDQRDARFAGLVATVAAEDPAWVQAFVPHLRDVMQMRTASVVAAVEYVAAGGPNGRQVVSAALQRPDEPAEAIGYWQHTRPGTGLPMALKRGIADALPRLYTQRNVLRYDGTGNRIRFADVIQLVHPKVTGAQNSLFRFLLDERRHGDGYQRIDEVDHLDGALDRIVADHYLQRLPEESRRMALGSAVDIGWSWERLAGWLPGGMDAAAWEAVIPNMGYMALLRNLRNFDQAEISTETASLVASKLMSPDEVARSRQFPLRFLSAWRSISSMRWALALETALDLSLANVPSLPGRTLVMIDVSPSMRDRLSGRSERRRWEAAAIFGYALAKRSEHPTLVAYSGYNSYQWTSRRLGIGLGYEPDYNATLQAEDVTSRLARPLLTSLDATEADVAAGNGTETWETLRRFYDGHDRVVILTDEQTRGSAEGTESIPAIYTFNLGGYEPAHLQAGTHGRYTFGGLTDAAFRMIPLLERKRSAGWSEVFATA